MNPWHEPQEEERNAVWPALTTPGSRLIRQSTSSEGADDTPGTTSAAAGCGGDATNAGVDGVGSVVRHAASSRPLTATSANRRSVIRTSKRWKHDQAGTGC